MVSRDDEARGMEYQLHERRQEERESDEKRGGKERIANDHEGFRISVYTPRLTQFQ